MKFTRVLRQEVAGRKVIVQLVLPAAARTEIWGIGGFGLSNPERRTIMSAEDLALVLPLRPDELAWLLVSDVDLGRREMRFATRLGGGDWTKGGHLFTVPLPEELVPLAGGSER